jgi:hypothetical protein
MGDDFESNYWTGIGGNKLLTSIVRLLCSYAVSNELRRQSFKMDDRPAGKAPYVGPLRVRPATAEGIGPIGDYPRSGTNPDGWRGKAECQSQTFRALHTKVERYGYSLEWSTPYRETGKIMKMLILSRKVNQSIVIGDQIYWHFNSVN